MLLSVVLFGFPIYAYSAVTAQNDYVEISIDSINVDSIIVQDNVFYGSVYLKNDEQYAKIHVQACHGYKLISSSDFMLALGGSCIYRVQTADGREDIEEGEIILPKVDIQYGELTELTEETTNVYVGYASCVNGYESEPCRQRLRPVSIAVSPKDKPAGSCIALSFPDGQLLEETADGLQPAEQSYPITEIASKKFFLHGHSPSSAPRDCTLKAVHSLSESKDLLCYSVVHATFEVVSDNFSVREDDCLIDNCPAIVKIKLQGFDSSDRHIFSLKAEPIEKENIVNKCGTNIAFFPTDDPLVWRTSKIYWYGISPNYCCYFNRFRYIFSLQVDNNICDSTSSYFVKMEKRAADMIGGIGRNYVSVYSTPQKVSDGANGYRCQIIFRDLIKTTNIVMGALSDQYAEEALEEELFHAKQWLGEVSLDEGGQGDCGTAEGVCFFAKTHVGETFYVYGDSPMEVKNRAILKIVECESLEENVCYTNWVLERGFIELKAKEHVGYNAAWKYHCTYEKEYGQKPENLKPNRILNAEEE